MLAAAGVAADAACPLDGGSLLHVLQDPQQRFERPMAWRMKQRGQRAHRHGDWKYLKVDGHGHLFDIFADERDRANLAKHQPERLAVVRHRPGANGRQRCLPLPGLLRCRSDVTVFGMK